MGFWIGFIMGVLGALNPVENKEAYLSVAYVNGSPYEAWFEIGEWEGTKAPLCGRALSERWDSLVYTIEEA